MGKEINPLLDLAWSILPERVIIKRLAAKAIRKEFSWEKRGGKGAIRALVKNSRPPRGRYKPRVEAVVREMDRQAKVRKERAANPRIDWEAWKPKWKRHRYNDVWQSRHGHFRSCYDIAHVDGATVWLVEKNWRMNVLVIEPRFTGIGPRQMIFVKVTDSRENIAEALMATYGTGAIRSALVGSRVVLLDFVNLETRVETPSGSDEVFPWETVESLRR